LGDDASQPSQAAQDTPQTAQLREFVAELAARVAAMEAARDRQARVRELLDDAGYPPEPPRRPPRHAAPKPKRDRPPGWRVITGGMAAFAPLALPGHSPVPAASAVAVRHVWVSRRAQSVVTVLLLALGAMAATPAVAAGGPGRDAHPAACAAWCASGEGNAGRLLPGSP
jgi:hypothetical protein